MPIYLRNVKGLFVFALTFHLNVLVVPLFFLIHVSYISKVVFYFVNVLQSEVWPKETALKKKNLPLTTNCTLFAKIDPF